MNDDDGGGREADGWEGLETRRYYFLFFSSFLFSTN